MDNHFQFSLRYRDDSERVLMYDFNPWTPQRRLLDCIDPKHPNGWDLIVLPFPEGVLLYAMFREMAPNQNIPSWNYALFVPVIQNMFCVPVYREELNINAALSH